MAVWLDAWVDDGAFEIAKVHGGNFIERWVWLELCVYSETYKDGDVEWFWDASVQNAPTKDNEADEMRVAGGGGYISNKDAKQAARSWLGTVCGAEVLSNEDRVKTCGEVTP